MTLPKKGLKTRPYSMDMNKEDHMVTPPKKDLKTRPYSMDMNKEDHIVTLPKKGLKTRPYNIGMEKKDLKTKPYSKDMNERDLNKYDYTIYMDMEKKDLKKLTKGQLIKLLLKQKKSKKVRNHEGLLDNDPFKDEVAQEPAKHIKSPKPTRKPLPPPIPQVEDHIINVPVPKIRELNKALKGHAKSYGIELQDNLNRLNHFTKTKALVESHLENLLKDMKGFKFIETLEVMFEKDTIDSKTGKRVSIYKTAFFNGKAKTITKANDIEPELSMSRQEILNVIDKWVSEGPGWVIDRIDSHCINVTLYKPLNGSSYTELPTELRNPKKGLINIKNKDNECFRWCHIRHLNPQIEHPERIKKGDKQMINELIMAIMKKVQGCEQSEEMNNEKNKRSYTEAYQTHEDCGSAYKVICCYDDKYNKPIQTYRGENAVYKFMEKMLEEVEYCKAVIKKQFNKPLVMTKDDEQCFKTMDGCHICGEKYDDKDVRVRDHCHITGKFGGSAHQECNLKLRIKPEDIKIPVIFHNLRGYDSHFIMQQIGEIAKKHAYTNKKGEKQDFNINAIPNNMEKYMAFMLGNHLTFIDSFQFMSSSLDKLVSNLPQDDLIYTSKVFKGKRLNLMSQKGVYPYDFMYSFEKFDQTELPTKDQFYSVLNDQHIMDDEYDHAEKVWKTFKIKTVGECHDLYLGSDVLLLTDVFKNFRKTCMQYYKLDPCHYFTSPGLSWNAMLNVENDQY